jgi:hypothetical protein
MKNRCYTELSKLKTFEERFAYLKLGGTIGHETFGFDRYLNQTLYHSERWKRARRDVIIRDCGCDLGVDGFEIYGRVTIHHMNQVTIDDIIHDRDWIYDPEYLICTSHNTHNAIHYGDESLLVSAPIERTQNDTCPWRR